MKQKRLAICSGLKSCDNAACYGGHWPLNVFATKFQNAVEHSKLYNVSELLPLLRKINNCESSDWGIHAYEFRQKQKSASAL